MSMYCASCTFDREYLLYVCTGDVYGEEAIAKYSADPESMRFDCYYIGGVAKMTIEGNVISGVDAEGNEIFRHTYAPVEIENNENGFIFYKTEDENAGQFTYFAFGGDTMAETFHLEFRYAEDLADLMSWFEGNYAYWNVGAIAENYTEEEILGAINLFATENKPERKHPEAENSAAGCFFIVQFTLSLATCKSTGRVCHPHALKYRSSFYPLRSHSIP